MDSFLYLHCLLFFLLSPGFLVSCSTISYNALESYRGTTRNLLQQKQSCPVNFENENYTIITSQCKGPVYPRDPCCNSFLQIACPHWEQINDEKTNCASTLFSYINVYGKYPPGLFASMCKGGKEGLSCEKVEKSASRNSHSSRVMATSVHVPSLMITVGVVIFVLELSLTRLGISSLRYVWNIFVRFGVFSDSSGEPRDPGRKPRDLGREP
ncbi:GPI-anchored protein LLG2-like [Rutidosis leptorrhynchoides]|uniref:GPI-anchored protein LLG2-like n=1 Tax=Rutidosis leptorrhynchoides TaxID=125765 RepID=UPI003A998A43